MERLKNKAHTLLKQSEGIFRTDMVYLAKGGFWLVSAQVTTGLVALVMSILYANLLTAEIYGVYKYILSASGILGVLTLTGLPTSLTRAISRGFEGEFKRSIILNIKWSLLFVAGSLLTSGYYFYQGNNTLGIGLLIVSILAPIIDTLELYNSVLNGKKDFKSSGLIRVLKTIGIAICIAITIYLTNNIIAIVLSYFLATALANWLALVYLENKWSLNNNLDPETPRLAKHTSIMSSLSSFAEQIDNVLVFHFLGAAPLAVYNFAQAIPENISGIFKNLGLMALPKFAERKEPIVFKTILNKSFILMIIGSLIAVPYFLIAPALFEFMFPQYLESIKYSQAYILIVLLMAIVPQSFIDAKVEIANKYALSLSTSLFKIASISIGIYYWGLWGAIISRIVYKLFGFVVTHYFAYKIIGKSTRD